MIRVFKRVSLGLSAAGASYALLNGLQLARPELAGWSRPGPKYRSDRPYGTNSIATHSRHTGQPHRHRREIARNLGVSA